MSARWEGAFRYSSDQDELRLRLFGGRFLRSEHQDPIYNFRMDGRNGPKDFLFEHYYFARSRTKGTLSQQFARTEGGFRTPTALGSSDDWIASATATLELPLPNWPTVELFYSNGLFPAPFSDGIEGIYEGGVSISLWEDIFEVHLPLLLSPAIEEEHSVNEIGVPERIRFELRLDRIKPFERLRTQSL